MVYLELFNYLGQRGSEPSLGCKVCLKLLLYLNRGGLKPSLGCKVSLELLLSSLILGGQVSKKTLNCRLFIL